MKICMPVEADMGLKSKIYGHFGSTPYFAIYDTESESLEMVDNRNKEHVHGRCNPLSELQEKEVDIIVVRGIGTKAIQKLATLDIKPCQASAEETVEDIIKSFQNDELMDIDQNSICRHHG